MHNKPTVIDFMERMNCSGWQAETCMAKV